MQTRERLTWFTHVCTQARRETDELADNLLKMPPQPPEREEQGQVISRDHKLEGFDDHRYVFTDISEGTDNKVSVLLE